MRTNLGRLGALTLAVLACAAAAFAQAPATSATAPDNPANPANPAMAGPANGFNGGGAVVLQFDTMIGNPGNGDPANVVRGFDGAGSPWSIRAVHGFLRSNGELVAVVQNLIISGGADKGSNPVSDFRAALSCQDPTDATQGQLFFTGTARAETGSGNTAGDSVIVGRLQMPDHCIAPLILIGSPPSATSPNGAWFAVTGF